MKLSSNTRILVLILILLLVILLVANTKNKFGNIYSGNAVLSYVGSNSNINSPTIRIIYTLPDNCYSQGPAPANTYFYKWPMLYLFDPSGITDPPGTYDDVYFNAQAALPGNKYARPGIDKLADYAAQTGTISQYLSPTTLPSGTNMFENLMKLNIVLVEDGESKRRNPVVTPGFNLVYPTISPAFSGNDYTSPNTTLLNPGTTVSWDIVGDSNAITPGLTIRRNYVLGIAPQLNLRSSDPLATDYGGPFPRRYGVFKYKNFVFDTTEGYPGQPQTIAVDFGQMLI